MEDFNQVKVKIPVRQELKGSRYLSLGCRGHTLGGPQRSRGHPERGTALLELMLVGRRARQEHNQTLILFVASGRGEYGLKVTVLHLGNLSMRPLGRCFLQAWGARKVTPLRTTDGLNLS